MTRAHQSQHTPFAALAEQSCADLFRYALWLCGDKVIAEDLVQETLMRARRSFASLKAKPSAKHWLFRLLRREHAGLQDREILELNELDADRGLEAQRDGASPEALALRRAVAQLEPVYREPLVLQVVGGFSCEEIAAMLELPSATVMTRVFRARKRLRDGLTEQTLEAATA